MELLFGKWKEMVLITVSSVYICEVIKKNQSEDGNIDFKIKECLLFPIVFGTIQLLISLEPIDQCEWGFLQNAAVKMVHTVNS